MIKRKGHVIQAVDPGSIAALLELEPGDRVISIDGHLLEDIFDYEYRLNSDMITMVVEKADGEEWELEIENQYEDLGITFENGLMSDYRSCKNKCIFCFIDQMPKGMRETLYFKDDDSRLSFLQGNYITLTNMSDHDIERIIQFKLSPINISVHTTNAELRCQMLNNRFAGQALKKIDRLFEAGIRMNGQIVLCKGINDGPELERTIKDLSAYLPYMESLSVVPVGISKYRQGLFPMEPLTGQDAEQVLLTIKNWQNKLFAQHGVHFVHGSDELYLLSGRPFPEKDCYDGYLQLENGVGMVVLLEHEVALTLEQTKDEPEPEVVSIATGKLAYPLIKQLADRVSQRYPQKQILVYAIENNFFGPLITVAGLITGQDLIRQLTGKKLGQRLLLPGVMFRSGEEVFLDDVTRQELQKALQVPVNIVKSSGYDFVNALLHPDTEHMDTGDGTYELKELNHE